MVTRLKPQRVKSSNSPQVGQNLGYEDSNNFKWQDTGSGVGDMKYSDFQWQTLTGNAITIEDISNNITPSSNFTVSAGTVKPGIEYVLRVNTGNTAYTMTLGTGITNPNGYSTDLQPNTVNQFNFIATSNNQLELEGNAGGMTILSYGNSTWNDFITAYNKNAIVYCRASSNSNPATGSQTRLAFMAYVNNADTPTEVEFQYYRSRSSHSTAQTQQDEVYVYKLTSSGTWTVTARDTATRITTGTGLTNSYTTSSGITTMTIVNDGVLTVNGANGTVTVNDIKQSATAPANPTAGTAWYDTTNGALKVYNGSAWDTIATGGAISDTAYGPGWNGQTTTAPSQNAVYDKISSIDALIPSEATSSNKLADKAFVGDSINSVTAYYITKNANGDQFATYAELAAATTFYSGGVVRVPTMNDYTIVLDDETHDHATTRYIYNNGWEYQYTVNETALTQAQLNALNSGITAAKVSTYDGYATGKQDTLVSGTNIKTVNSNSLLGSGDIVLNDVKVSATAPSSPTEGMVWYDTTNDQLKVYDGTNWNVTGKEYNAGEGIAIGTYNDYSAMQGPAPDGFHVPLNTEWQAVYDIWTALGGGSSDGTNFGIALKLPFAGYRGYWSAGVGNQSIYGYYWSSSRNSASYAYYMYLDSTVLGPQRAYPRAYGFSVRCFKNSPVIPTSSWTKLYGTSIEAGGIFWSSTDGLISLSSNGSTWITISDKNLGATQVWNSGDTLSEANCGKYYQWGNNYGFPRTGTIANQSTTQVDASSYGPGNYYSSDTFIKYDGRWDTTDNGNLWGGVTGVVAIDNAITNTGVLSVNGQTGNITIETFQLAPNSPLTPKYRRYGTQAQYDALTQYYTDEAGDTVYFTI